MLTAEDYKTFLKEGVIRKEINVGGIVFTVRVLNMQDVLLSDMVVDYLTSTAKSWTSPLQLSIETLVRLAFIVEKIDGEPVRPEITEKVKESVLDSLLGLTGEEEKQSFVRNVVKPRIQRLLLLPPATLEILTDEYGKLRQELRKFIEGEGGLPNS